MRSWTKVQSLVLYKSIEEEKIPNLPSSDPGTLVTMEETGSGKVKMETYMGYMKAMGGPPKVLLALFIFVLMMAMLTFNNYWLSLWFNDVLNGTVWDNQSVSSPYSWPTACSFIFNLLLCFHGFLLPVLILKPSFLSKI